MESTAHYAENLTLNHYRLYTQRNYNSLHLKNLCRFRQKLMKARTKVKIQLVTYVDLFFPELQYFFKSRIHTKACYSLLKELAAQSVGIKNDTLSLQILQSINQIELYTEQLTEIEKNIPEIDDISRFEKPCQLLAYAGLNPSVYQSGNFNDSRTRMSKRGSKLLRYALINEAWQITLVNDTFKKYYDLKISQGRRHYNTLGHVAHKLVRIIHKMMTDHVRLT